MGQSTWSSSFFSTGLSVLEMGSFSGKWQYKDNWITTYQELLVPNIQNLFSQMTRVESLMKYSFFQLSFGTGRELVKLLCLHQT
jgi:hypothetical protein